MTLIRNFIVAFSMYSKIPMPKVIWDRDSMKYSLCCFPFVGAVIGILLYLWGNYGAKLPIGGNLHTIVLLLIPVIVTGGIHLDGYMDTIDALSSYQSKERKLEILKDSNSGAFAIIWGIIYFMLSFGIYGELEETSLLLVAMGAVLSRILSGYAVAGFTCAKNSGLASQFSKAADRSTVKIILLAELALMLALMIRLQPVGGALAGGVSLLAFVCYRHMAYREFGGITGDLAGFFLQVCELAIAAAVVIGDKIWY